MTVGVYGYRLTMEIKHFRAPREMHAFPLATRENLPSRSLAIPSRHQPSTRTANNRLIRLSIKATRWRKSLRFLRACLSANEIHVSTSSSSLSLLLTRSGRVTPFCLSSALTRSAKQFPPVEGCFKSPTHRRCFVVNRCEYLCRDVECLSSIYVKWRCIFFWLLPTLNLSPSKIIHLLVTLTEKCPN